MPPSSLDPSPLRNPSNPRFGYLDCEDAEKWTGGSNGTEPHHAEMWMQPLGIATNFAHYRCFASHFPSHDELLSLEALVICGSHYSVNDEHEWISEFAKFLRRVFDEYPHVRLLGGCFGAQMLGKALGGKVGKNPSGAFVFQVEHCAITDAMRERADFQFAWQQVHGTKAPPVAKESLALLESHGDQVLDLPPGATVLATSLTAAYECWAINSRVLAWQFHPEMSKECVLTKIFPFIAPRLGDKAAHFKDGIEKTPLDSALLLEMARAFVHRLNESPPSSE